MSAIPALQTLMQSADHHDTKIIESDVPLRVFVAGFFNYSPGWIKFLYQVRGGFVRLLGMKQERPREIPPLQPEDIPMQPGEKLMFFTVSAAAEDDYLIAEATESHLTAHLAIVVQPGQQKKYRYAVVTVVHYHRRTGKLYFNVIRPFHHLVVRKMMQAGAL